MSNAKNSNQGDSTKGAAPNVQQAVGPKPGNPAPGTPIVQAESAGKATPGDVVSSTRTVEGYGAGDPRSKDAGEQKGGTDGKDLEREVAAQKAARLDALQNNPLAVDSVKDSDESRKAVDITTGAPIPGGESMVNATGPGVGDGVAHKTEVVTTTDKHGNNPETAGPNNASPPSGGSTTVDGVTAPDPHPETEGSIDGGPAHVSGYRGKAPVGTQPGDNAAGTSAEAGSLGVNDPTHQGSEEGRKQAGLPSDVAKTSGVEPHSNEPPRSAPIDPPAQAPKKAFAVGQCRNHVKTFSPGEEVVGFSSDELQQLIDAGVVETR